MFIVAYKIKFWVAQDSLNSDQKFNLEIVEACMIIPISLINLWKISYGYNNSSNCRRTLVVVLLIVFRNFLIYNVRFFSVATRIADRCRTDDLVPNIRISCLLPCHVAFWVGELDILINRPTYQHCGAWASNRSSAVCWWSKFGGNYTVVVFLWGPMTKVPIELFWQLRILLLGIVYRCN